MYRKKKVRLKCERYISTERIRGALRGKKELVETPIGRLSALVNAGVEAVEEDE
jgi:hypothetical protein